MGQLLAIEIKALNEAGRYNDGDGRLGGILHRLMTLTIQLFAGLSLIVKTGLSFSKIAEALVVQLPANPQPASGLWSQTC